MAILRTYERERDAPAVRALFVELQDTERALAPDMPAGDLVADRYLAELDANLGEADGEIFVVEDDGLVVAYAAVLGHAVDSESDEAGLPYAYLTDMVVAATHRGRGFGRLLLARVESFARAKGRTVLRVSLLARNAPARALYGASGFVDRELLMEKPLTAHGTEGP